MVLYICHFQAGRGLGYNSSFPSLGRPTIVAVRIGCTVVTIPITRRAVRVVRIATKAQTFGPPSIFQPSSPASGASVPMPGLSGRRRILRVQRYMFFFYSAHFTRQNFFNRRHNVVFLSSEGSGGCTAATLRGHLAAHCMGFIATASLPAAQLRFLRRAWADPP